MAFSLTVFVLGFTVTFAAMIYVWSATDRKLRFESLPTDYEVIHSFCLGNVDDDEATDAGSDSLVGGSGVSQ